MHSLSLGRTIFAFAVSWSILAMFLAVLAHEGLNLAPTLGLGIALGFVAQEFAVGTTLLWAGRRSQRWPSPKSPPHVAVLIAAWNERGTIVNTLRSVLAQTDVLLEVIVADDGSTDGTGKQVLDAIQQGTVDGAAIRMLTLPHRGKGAALEAARKVASALIIVTIDADTELVPSALGRLVVPFQMEQVEAVAGSIVIRDASNWLTHFQFTEYLKNTCLRLGWSALGALDQVPGAFAAFRATAVEKAGGFPINSLTEDYEMVYRLYAAASREGRTILVPTVPAAQALTDPPRTYKAFLRQRTRWFAGFLITLFRFRHLILRPSAGTFGLVRLPLKVLDAALPIVGLTSLLSMLAGIVDGRPMVAGLTIALLCTRSFFDAALCGRAFALFDASAEANALDGRVPPRPRWWLAAALDPLTYVWLKQLTVLRAYPFALGRGTWESSRGENQPAEGATTPSS